MPTTQELADKKDQMVELVREWGFKVEKETPKLYQDPYCYGLINIYVETDEKNPDLIRNKGVREAYLTCELAELLNCDVLVVNPASVDEQRSAALKRGCSLSEDKSVLIQYFGEKHPFDAVDLKQLKADASFPDEAEVATYKKEIERVMQKKSPTQFFEKDEFPKDVDVEVKSKEKKEQGLGSQQASPAPPAPAKKT